MPTLYRLPRFSTLLILATLLLGWLPLSMDLARPDSALSGDMVVDAADEVGEDADSGAAMAAGLPLALRECIAPVSPHAGDARIHRRMADPPATPPPIAA